MRHPSRKSWMARAKKSRSGNSISGARCIVLTGTLTACTPCSCSPCGDNCQQWERPSQRYRESASCAKIRFVHVADYLAWYSRCVALKSRGWFGSGQLSVLEERFKEATTRMVEAEQRVKSEVVNCNKFADENDMLRRRYGCGYGSSSLRMSVCAESRLEVVDLMTRQGAHC